ncbi:MAG TPA: hypothetical protein VFT87_02270, partial [Candidatus Saccharimonadales bacterium]|nr:hypothetical protein [Candidatus Saccharimonadales bacterium]
LLNKLDKHATAVFSGEVPPAMQFLEPSKTLENSVDGLRDFIISLDKEKADRLRYKVEDDVVRIFITPYRTTITEKDLQFSQGDFNVELIIALGVEKREDLDKAIIAHGRILHDATVITLNANNQQSGLGAIDWHDPNASSLCEMLITMTEGLQKPGVIDAQIATAFLTGLVAATERFSNTQTSPRVMTLAAQMMAAGANQQLIATNIHTPVEVSLGAQPQATEPSPGKDGEIAIKHPKEEKSEEKLKEKEPKAQDAEDVKAAELKRAEEELARALPKVVPSAPPAGEPSLDALKEAIKEETAKEAVKKEVPSRKFIAEEPSEQEAVGAASALSSPESSWRERRIEPPTLGGTFTATSEQAMEDKAVAENEDRNQKILTHGDVTSADEQPAPAEQTPQEQPAEEPAPQPEPEPEPAPTLEPVVPQLEMPSSAPVEEPQPESALQPQIEQPAPVDVNTARQEVDAVLAAQPFRPEGNPLIATGAQQLPPIAPLPEPFAPQMPIQPPASAPQEPAPQPAPQITQITPGAAPAIPPMPHLPVSEPGGQFPPMPPALPDLPQQVPPPAPPSAFDTQPPAPAPTDPAQYKIPGQ